MKLFKLKREEQFQDYFEIAYDVFEDLTRRQIKEMLRELESSSKQTNYDVEVAEFVLGAHQVKVYHNAEYVDEIDEIAETIQAIEVRTTVSRYNPIAILNTTILTQDGNFDLRTIPLDEAKELLKDREIKSYVGHDSTAQALSLLLDREVAFNRELYTQQSGETALCFKLRGRVETGQDLDWETIEKMGYDLKLLTME